MKRGDAFGIGLIAFTVIVPLTYGVVAYFDRKNQTEEWINATVTEVRLSRTSSSGKCAAARTVDGFTVEYCPLQTPRLGDRIRVKKLVRGLTGRVTYVAES
jgi:hypothetical protein